MKGFKGFSPELTSVMGNGDKKTCSFRPGITLEVENAKTAREGFHFCEHPFGCLSYYPLDGKNRYFQIEAEGDIDEDDNDRLSCTKITLIRELNLTEMAMEEMIWMIERPNVRLPDTSPLIWKAISLTISGANGSIILMTFTPLISCALAMWRAFISTNFSFMYSCTCFFNPAFSSIDLRIAARRSGTLLRRAFKSAIVSWKVSIICSTFSPVMASIRRTPAATELSLMMRTIPILPVAGT